MVIDETILSLMKKYDKSFYIYEEKEIIRSINKLKENFTSFEFLYSVKTNPNKNIINTIRENKIGGDAASVNEVKLCVKAKMKKEDIIYSAPGKTKRDIEEIYDKCIITADSYHELELLNQIAKKRDIKLKIGIRINANYNVYNNKPLSSKYGIDEEDLMLNKEYIESFENLEIIGIHVHLQSQILDYKIIYNYYKYILDLAIFCKDKMNFNLEFINFGGGIGISYNDFQNDLNIELLGKMSDKLINEYRDRLNCRFIIESGRFIACKSGTYVTPIVDIKTSRNIKYLIVLNAYNGFFKPTISEMVVSYATSKENLKMYEPLFTSFDSYKVRLLRQNKKESMEREQVTIGGNLCTAVDIIAKDIELPHAEINDLIVINNAGSYAYTLTPILFSSQEKPLEIYLSKDNKLNIT